MKKIKNNFLLLLCLTIISSAAVAQERIIDRIIATVGNNPILQSELDTQFQQAIDQGEPNNDSMRCKVFEEILYQKLLLAQAQKDSLSVTEAQVEQEMDRRLQYYIRQFGSEEKFAEFYGKSTEDFKVDFRDNMRNLLLAQQMQGKIIGDVTVTPNEVKEYYNAIPVDSLPFINEEVEIGQIVKGPSISPEAKKLAKEKIEDIRSRIASGKSSFTTMAALYSEDPGSSNKGGLYEKIQRGQFVPEWDAQAFTLKAGELSPVFETVYGYFIIQVVERRGEEVDARSLLIAPKVETMDLLKAKLALDSIYDVLAADTISFSEAASRYSTDAESKHNGGLIVNPFNGSTRFEMDELGQYDQNVAFAINKLKVGQYTKPMPFTTSEGKQAYRILYLKTNIQAHQANLKDDYQRIQSGATSKKQQAVIDKWIVKKLPAIFVKIADDFKGCDFKHPWISKLN